MAARLIPVDLPEAATNNSLFISLLLAFLHNCYRHGFQILLFAILSAMAAFRRELSSNSVYQRKSRRSAIRSTVVQLIILDQDVTDIDNMLEGAGHFCSGGPLLSMTLAVWTRIALRRSFSFFEGDVSMPANTKLGTTNLAIDRFVTTIPSPTKETFLGDNNPQGNRDNIDNTEEEKNECPCSPEYLRRHSEGIGQNMTFLTLPPDSHIHLLCYLHPRDIISFACTSREALSVVDEDLSLQDRGQSTSVLLWKALWKRDYKWVVTRWDIGKQSLERSMSRSRVSFCEHAVDCAIGSKESSNHCGRMNPNFRHLESCLIVDIQKSLSTNISYKSQREDVKEAENEMKVLTANMTMKEFYFVFGETWLNYTLAGQNTSSQCLIGLHGHVFDITTFVESHPGSPETLLVQSGRDATSFFEDLGHSVGARKMAMKFCVVFDRGCIEENRGKGCGLLWTGEKLLKTEKDFTIESLPKQSWTRSHTAMQAMPMVRSKPRRSGTLQRIRAKFDMEEHMEQVEAEKWLSNALTCEDIIGSINVYYDVFLARWMSWYMDLDFQPVYLDMHAED